MQEVTCKFQLIEGGIKPYHGSEHAACWDLYAREIHWIHPKKVKIYLGIKIQPQIGFQAKITARSNIGKLDWELANGQGTVDWDYRGECFAIFNYNGDKNPIEPPYFIGERCVQIEMIPYYETVWIETDQLSETKRGEDGFGSTGK